MTEQEWLASEDPAAMLAALRKQDDRVGVGHDISDRKLRLFACACVRQVWHLLTDDAPCPDAQCRGRGRWRIMGLPATCPVCKGKGRINRSRRAVEVAERLADGEATEEERYQAWVHAEPGASQRHQRWGHDAKRACHVNAAGAATGNAARLDGDTPADLAARAALLRCIVGNPFRPWVVAEQNLQRALREYQIFDIDWLTPTVLSLAQAAYDERRPDGTLDPARLAILADALEEAGCTDEAILMHLRSYEPCQDEAHVKGGGNYWCPQCQGTESDHEGWRPLRSPHVRGCWVVDICLNKE